MWSNDIFQQRITPQAKENQKNPEQSDSNPSEKKPGLLKRVGRWLIRIAEVPLHVVGGALDATGHLLHGRLDKSVRSLAGGIHAGIREIPLLGDVIKKIESTTSRIHEKMEFTNKDDSDIQNAEERLKKAVEWVLDPLKNKTTEELKKEADEFLKTIKEEAEKEKKNPKFYEYVNSQSYQAFQKEVSWLPDFADLQVNQKEMLQVMYFWREEKADLKNPKVQQYLQKFIKAGSPVATKDDKYDFMLYSTENGSEIQDLFHYSALERATVQYTFNIMERARRFEWAPAASRNEAFSHEEEMFTWTMSNKFTQLFGNIAGTQESGWH